MKKTLILLIFCLLVCVQTSAQFAKPLRKEHQICRNTSAWSLGVTGSFAANDMIHTAVKTSALKGYFAPTFGFAAEYNGFKWISVGLNASYAMRGTNEETATVFLTSFTSTTSARVNYQMRLNGLELSLPVTLYLSSSDTWRPYVYVAPRLSLWMNGNVHWERTYDDGSYPPLVYDTTLNRSMARPIDVSVVGGVGVCRRIMMRRTQMFVKFDVSYGISVLNTFSQKEADAAAQTAGASGGNTFVFYGWGDIEHETLGKRYLQNVEARLTFMLPLRKHLKDACAFKQNYK